VTTRAASKATQYPGISRLTRTGQPDRFMVSYRVRGLGQRTKQFRTISEAKAFQAKVRDPAHATTLRRLERGRITLGGYFLSWLPRKRNLSASTRARYEGVGANYIVPGSLGSMRLSDIERSDVERWVTDLTSRCEPPTVDKTYRTLRACLNTAVLDGLIPSNPATRVAMPDIADRRPFFLTANQVAAIGQELPERDRALLYFLAYTGVRMGEATALRVHNLDLPRRRATITENSPEVGGRKLTTKTKTKTTRRVDMSDALVYELADHLERFGTPSASRGGDPSAYVFTSARGGQVRQGNWRERVFQPACIRADVTRAGPKGSIETPRVHDLRHTAASLAAAAGYTLHEVKEMLGHSSIQVTSDRYLHLFEDAKAEKAQWLGIVMQEARNELGNLRAIGIAGRRAASTR
jgi:integrase